MDDDAQSRLLENINIAFPDEPNRAAMTGGARVEMYLSRFFRSLGFEEREFALIGYHGHGNRGTVATSSKQYNNEFSVIDDGYDDVDFLRTYSMTPTPNVICLALQKASARERIVVGGIEYVVDSMMLMNYWSPNGSSNTHALCGVTCGGQRMIYNGWTLKHDADVGGFTACNLFPYDWVSNVGSFCLDEKKCEMKAVSNGREESSGRKCFSAIKGRYRVYFYVIHQG